MTTKSNEPRYFLFGAVSVGVPSCGKFQFLLFIQTFPSACHGY